MSDFDKHNPRWSIVGATTVFREAIEHAAELSKLRLGETLSEFAVELDGRLAKTAEQSATGPR